MSGVSGDVQRAAQLLVDATSVCVVGHLRPDADAVGSVSAMVAALTQLGKSATGVIGDLDPLPDNLQTIPGSDNIAMTATLPEADLVVTVDCGSLDRTGWLADQIEQRAASTLVIDHHASNPGFGAVNLIDSTAESTTTILARLFNFLKVEITPEIAQCLYSGLVTDTGSFRWGRPEMHELAGELLAHGLDSRKIAADLIDGTSLEDLRMVGEVVSTVQTYQAGDRVIAVLIADHATISGHSMSAVEGLVDMIRSIEGTDISAVFKEYIPGRYAVSLRSPTVNVGEIAVALEGGGHVPAAGYTAVGSGEAVVEKLLDTISTLSTRIE